MSPPFENDELRSAHGDHYRSESPCVDHHDNTPCQKSIIQTSIDDLSVDQCEFVHFDSPSLQAQHPLKKETCECCHTGEVCCAVDDSRHSQSMKVPITIDDHENGNVDDNDISSCNSARDKHDHDENNGRNVPSNQKLLGIAFFSFMTFALVQLVFAFVADSQAMLGDVIAMIVDSFTYLFNWIAERKKKNYDRQHAETVAVENEHNTVSAETTRICQRNRRKMVLKLEIIPPFISVTALLLVTAYVTRRAISLLVLDMHRNRSEQGQPNLKIMLTFSCINLFLDAVNLFCFSKAKHALSHATEDPNRDDENNNNSTVHDSNHHPNKGIASLNMCSAFTHVFADTMRSIAVILAALLAIIWPVVTPEVADSAAALVVSCLILLSVLPLLRRLWHSVAELRAILAEERS